MLAPGVPGKWQLLQQRLLQVCPSNATSVPLWRWHSSPKDHQPPFQLHVASYDRRGVLHGAPSLMAAVVSSHRDIVQLEVAAQSACACVYMRFCLFCTSHMLQVLPIASENSTAAADQNGGSFECPHAQDSLVDARVQHSSALQQACRLLQSCGIQQSCCHATHSAWSGVEWAWWGGRPGADALGGGPADVQGPHHHSQ